MPPHSPHSPHRSPHRSPHSPQCSPHALHSPHSQARKLAGLLAKNLSRVIDVFREWDKDEDGQVTKKEFTKGLASLKMSVDAADIDALFAHFDPDGSGSLDCKELQSVLRNSAPTRLEAHGCHSSLQAAMAAATESGWTTLART